MFKGMTVPHPAWDRVAIAKPLVGQTPALSHLRLGCSDPTLGSPESGIQLRAESRILHCVTSELLALSGPPASTRLICLLQGHRSGQWPVPGATRGKPEESTHSPGSKNGVLRDWDVHFQLVFWRSLAAALETGAGEEASLQCSLAQGTPRCLQGECRAPGPVLFLFTGTEGGSPLSTAGTRQKNKTKTIVWTWA